MELAINITEKQKELLKIFAKNHHLNSDKNMATRNPLFIVETRKERLINKEYEDADAIYFHVHEWVENYNTVEDIVEDFWFDGKCPIKIKPFDEVFKTKIRDCNGHEIYIFDEEDYLKAYGFDLSYEIGYIKYYYEPIAYFFIFEEAEKYLKYQKHNLTSPRINCIGAGYANYGDYHHFYDLLMSIGTKLNEGELCLSK